MYLLVIFVFFMAGMTIAGVFGVAKGQGLAGGAIIFMYGIITAIIALILSLFLVNKAKIGTIIKINKFLGILFFLAVCLFIYRVINKNKTPLKEYPNNTTTNAYKEMSMVSYKELKKPVLTLQNSKHFMGIGFFKPNYFEYPTLYFYSGVNLEKPLIEHTPLDSVVIARDEYNNPTTAYAPPWLYPEHLKLDYGIIIFKVFCIGRDFVKVEVNKKTNQMSYLNKNEGTFMSWQEFLLLSNSVEFNDDSNKKVLVKPLDYAGVVKVEFNFMQPLLIEEDWIYVKLVDGSLKELGKGWIRWKKENVLLITYSILS